MDLTDEQWRLIEPILAVPVPGLPAPSRRPQEARAHESYLEDPAENDAKPFGAGNRKAYEHPGHL
jgi:hypothetical protein